MPTSVPGSVLLFVLATISSSAQNIPLITLKPATNKFAEEFSSIRSVRELSTGVVLVSDDRENRIAAITIATGAVSAVSRKGDGPGEYRNIMRDLMPLGSDSTLLHDQNGRRWLVFDGTKAATVSPQTPWITALGGHGPEGQDSKGFLVATIMALPPTGKRLTPEEFEKVMSDSVSIVRISRTTGKVDTIGRFPGSGANVSGGTVPGGIKASRGGTPVFAEAIGMGEDITVFPDGWIAIHRGIPHRIDWCAPNAKCTVGPLMPIPTREMNESDKLAYMTWESATVGWLPPKTLPAQIDEWPVLLPIFKAPLLPTPEGRLLGQRFPYAEHAKEKEYYLIDRRNAIAGRFILPLSDQVVGFGAKSIYIKTRDADGVEHLRRHAWP